jgi:hypothetical protein
MGIWISIGRSDDFRGRHSAKLALGGLLEEGFTAGTVGNDDEYGA